MAHPADYEYENYPVSDGMPFYARNSIMGPAINSTEAIHGNRLPVLVTNDLRLIRGTFAENSPIFPSAKLPHPLYRASNFTRHPAQPAQFHSQLDLRALQLSPILPKNLSNPSGEQLGNFGSPAAYIMPYLHQTDEQITKSHESLVDSSLGKPKQHKIEATRRVAKTAATRLSDSVNATTNAYPIYPGTSAKDLLPASDLYDNRNAYPDLAARNPNNPLRQKRERTCSQPKRGKHRFIEVEMDLDEMEDGGDAMYMDNAQPHSNSPPFARSVEEEEAACALLKLSMNQNEAGLILMPDPPGYAGNTSRQYESYHSRQTQTIQKSHASSSRSSSSPIRRQMHIVSEQKRRQTINEGFEELRNLVPACKNYNDSKASVLKKTVYYIKYLQEKLAESSDGVVSEIRPSFNVDIQSKVSVGSIVNTPNDAVNEETDDKTPKYDSFEPNSS